jgi:hypothetical protein
MLQFPPKALQQQLRSLLLTVPRRSYGGGATKSTPVTVAQFLNWKPEAELNDVVVNGYVRSVRTMKAGCFVHIGDGSSRQPLQAVLSDFKGKKY